MANYFKKFCDRYRAFRYINTVQFSTKIQFYVTIVCCFIIFEKLEKDNYLDQSDPTW